MAAFHADGAAVLVGRLIFALDLLSNQEFAQKRESVWHG
jgi:hypothetical protein